MTWPLLSPYIIINSGLYNTNQRDNSIQSQSTKSILITGVNGFVGKHLARAAHSAGHNVIGTGMDDQPNPEISDYLETYIPKCDLTNVENVRAIPLENLDTVINLAGLAQVGASFGKEDEYTHINVRVHTVLAEALLAIHSTARIVTVSTGAVYDSHQSMPLNEESALITEGSPYAMSKISMEQAMNEFIEKGLDVVIARPFNHIGPGQLPGFLVPDMAAQLRDDNTVTVGNLKTSRDYTDVRDVVQAYLLLATKDSLKHRVYNVCSGKDVMGEEILAELCRAFNKASVETQVNPKFIRPNDPLKIVGSHDKLTNDTGWQPTIPLATTLTDFVAGL